MTYKHDSASGPPHNSSYADPPLMNGFVVLVGDHQALSLDEEIDLAGNAELTILKLVPLTGG